MTTEHLSSTVAISAPMPQPLVSIDVEPVLSIDHTVQNQDGEKGDWYGVLRWDVSRLVAGGQCMQQTRGLISETI